MKNLIQAIAEAAAAWQDPDYGPREEAVARTLEAPNFFTEEAVAFAVNQQMQGLSAPALEQWLRGRHGKEAATVGVLNPGNVPLVELQDCLAVLLTGHRYLGALPSESPYLLPAFLADVRRRAPRLEAGFAGADDLFARADALIATGTDETRAWAAARCTLHGIPPERRLLRGQRFAVAVIDGRETEAERENLAEDALLHEGQGCRNVALIWAPAGLSPDPYLDAFAAFRGVFPAHPRLPEALKMQRAFLEAVGQPHALGEDLSFLVSKGEPEVQRPGHLRWTEYADIEEVNAWLARHEAALQLVVARPAVAARLRTNVALEEPGEAQRPPLDWRPDAVDTVDFLAALR